MLEAYAKNTARIDQEIAKVRHNWTDSLREEFIFYAARGWKEDADRARDEFMMWAEERAYYARLAMRHMGVTEDDQFYA